jgi:hypothetical protein
MTDYMKEYRLKEAARQKAKKDLLKVLNADQKAALNELLTETSDMLQTIYECQDVWMSQVGKLDMARHKVDSLVWSSDDA